MFTIDTFLHLVLALAGGVVIGLEREKFFNASQGGHPLIAGVRTFTLISLLGFLSAMATSVLGTHRVWTGMLFSIITLISVSYYVSYMKHNHAGITTEISMLLTYMMGSLVWFGYVEFAIALTILLVLILSLHNQSKLLVEKISGEEIRDSLKFGIIAFIILPLLPNQQYGPGGLFNPYEIRLMVVVVSGIGFVGYILTKVVGTKKGIGLTGFIGGIASSTAVTTSLSQLSKKAKDINPFIFATIVSAVISFVRVGGEVYAFNRELFASLVLPLVVMGGVGMLAAVRYFRFRQSETQQEPKLQISSPFSLKPALFFGGFFALIICVSKLALVYLPVESLYVIALFSGLADVDAITLTVARLPALPTATGTITILIAVAANTMVKGIIAYMFGARNFARHIIAIFAIVVVAGISTAILI